MEYDATVGTAKKVAGMSVFLLVVLGIIQIVLGEGTTKSVALTANESIALEMDLCRLLYG